MAYLTALTETVANPLFKKGRVKGLAAIQSFEKGTRFLVSQHHRNNSTRIATLDERLVYWSDEDKVFDTLYPALAPIEAATFTEIVAVAQGYGFIDIGAVIVDRLLKEGTLSAEQVREAVEADFAEAQF